MRSSSTNRLAAVVVAVVLIIGIGVAAYFLFFKKSEGSGESTTTTPSTPTPPTPTPTDPTGSTPGPPEKIYKGTLFVNNGQGDVVLVDLNAGVQQVMVQSEIFGITTFDYFKKKNTIYYGTSESNQPVLFSSGDSKLTKSKEWTKTAVAVDSGTMNKIYVVDRPEKKVYVLDLEDKYVHEIMIQLEDPRDIILNPYERIMFILQEYKILQVDMDGSNPKTIVRQLDLQAMAINHDRKEIFYATSNQVKSYSYKDNKISEFTLRISGDNSIVSLSSVENQLYLGMSREDPLPDVIIVATLQNDSYVKLVQAPPVHPKFMQSIKLYDDKDGPAENPCFLNNAGCEHLCLLSNNDKKYSCVCQVGWRLTSDLKRCEKED